MHALRSRRPSGAMVVAVIALVFAISGSAVAASHLVSGNSMIKKRSLSGNRLRNHTLTGRQINLKKLGKVPSAANADHATSATSAGFATSAGSATNAGNANTVGGQPASAFEPAANFIRTGLVTAGSGQTVPLASFGPFTLTLDCVANGSDVEAVIDATSTVANSDGYGTEMIDAKDSYDVLSTQVSSGGFAETNQNPADFFTPNGNTYVAILTLGQNYLGVRCYANALISTS